ncbi:MULTISPECIES: hypothetical protein [unclassified Streptomyces]|uniref:hypothetical protein n=1 Tax=unclassified Streptomyces TaxID=2593676 RepID=UPI002E1714BC|nr:MULTISPECIES: hypothetical protein [unclassified Streptomyces]
MTCEQVKECVQDWAPGAAYGATHGATDITVDRPDNVIAPVELEYTTSSGGSADVVDDGGGYLRIVRSGLWEVTMLMRFSAGTTYAAALYANILGVDTSAWFGTSIPITPKGTTSYSVGATVVGVVNVAEGSPAVVSAGGGQSAYAMNAQISTAMFVFKRLGPSLSSTGSAPVGADAFGPGAEIERERAQLAADA